MTPWTSACKIDCVCVHLCLGLWFERILFICSLIDMCACFFFFHFLFKLVPSVPFYFFFALGLLCPFRYHVMLFTLRRSEEENIKRFHHCMSTAK